MPLSPTCRWGPVGWRGSASGAPASHRPRRARQLKALSRSPLPWLSQSCTSNWIQAAAITFSVVAGMNSSRVRRARLTRLGSGFQDPRRRFGPRLGDRDVAAEPGADASHRRPIEVVVAAIDGARREVAAVPGRPGRRVGQAGVMEVPLPKSLAETHDAQDSQRQRHPIPAEAAVEGLADVHDHVVQDRNAHRSGPAVMVDGDGSHRSRLRSAAMQP